LIEYSTVSGGTFLQPSVEFGPTRHSESVTSSPYVVDKLAVITAQLSVWVLFMKESHCSSVISGQTTFPRRRLVGTTSCPAKVCFKIVAVSTAAADEGPTVGVAVGKADGASEGAAEGASLGAPLGAAEEVEELPFLVELFLVELFFLELFFLDLPLLDLPPLSLALPLGDLDCLSLFFFSELRSSSSSSRAKSGDGATS